MTHRSEQEASYHSSVRKPLRRLGRIRVGDAPSGTWARLESAWRHLPAGTPVCRHGVLMREVYPWGMGEPFLPDAGEWLTDAEVR